ncbi:hypothetical protein [Ciceribacter azotifigens]
MAYAKARSIHNQKSFLFRGVSLWIGLIIRFSSASR